MTVRQLPWTVLKHDISGWRATRGPSYLQERIPGRRVGARRPGRQHRPGRVPGGRRRGRRGRGGGAVITWFRRPDKLLSYCMANTRWRMAIPCLAPDGQHRSQAAPAAECHVMAVSIRWRICRDRVACLGRVLQQDLHKRIRETQPPPAAVERGRGHPVKYVLTLR